MNLLPWQRDLLEKVLRIKAARPDAEFVIHPPPCQGVGGAVTKVWDRDYNLLHDTSMDGPLPFVVGSPTEEQP